VGGRGRKRHLDHRHRHARCSCADDPGARREAGTCHPGRQRHSPPESFAVSYTVEPPLHDTDHSDPVTTPADRPGAVTFGDAVAIRLAFSLPVAIADPIG